MATSLGTHARLTAVDFSPHRYRSGRHRLGYDRYRIERRQQLLTFTELLTPAKRLMVSPFCIVLRPLSTKLASADHVLVVE